MGSPAHAGIDLSTPARVAGQSRRFPRTRGDRPVSIAAEKADIEVPPHTRG